MRKRKRTTTFFNRLACLFLCRRKSITYGDSWVDHNRDTIYVHDTVNIGTTDGTYIYDVYRTYQLVKSVDTFGGHLAVIVANDSGNFEGQQSNTITNVALRAHGPIGGSDTTFLDLVSGRVFLRTIRMSIPAIVLVTSSVPLTDIIEVRSTVENYLIQRARHSQRAGRTIVSRNKAWRNETG